MATNRPKFSAAAFTEGASEESTLLTDQTYSRSETWKFADSADDLTNANDDYNRAYRKDYSTGPDSVQPGTGFEPEMVQEFRVTSTAVDAEFGGAAGGLLNMVTRSGVNIWHGDFTFFAQHEKGNATQPEVADGNRPRFRRYQPGVSANGPLRRDRSFISGALEHENESVRKTAMKPNMPRLAAPM